MNYKDLSVSSYYSIFCGFLKIDPGAFVKSNHWVDWRNRLDPELNLDKYLDSVYYDTYLNQILRHKDLLHLTFSPYIKDGEFIRVVCKDREISLKVEYFDVYLFPLGYVLFSWKVCPETSIDLVDISDINFVLKGLEGNFKVGEEETTVRGYLERILSGTIRLDDHWDAYLPQLKTYCSIDLDQNMESDDRNRLLFELASNMPLGSSEVGENHPTDRFYQETIKQGSIEIFGNWSAIALFDSFIRISNKYPDIYRSWESDYFLIYIHGIYQKFYLFVANTQLTDVTIVTKRTEQLKDEFTEFINDNDLKSISYKFLPNTLLKTIRRSLDLDEEIGQVERKVRNLNEATRQRKQSKMTSLLLVISMLSILSVLTDFSDWLQNMGVSEWVLYENYLSLGIGLIIIAVIFLILKTRK